MSSTIREEITKCLGVEPILINSSLVSAQHRKRLYWTNIPDIVAPKDLGLVLNDIIISENDNDKSLVFDKPFTYNGTHGLYCATIDNVKFKARAHIQPVNVKSYCLMASDKDKMHIKKIYKNGKVRILSVDEYKRLQTIPDWYKFPDIANSHKYKMIGNGWTVDVISHILSFIPKLKNYELNVLSMYDGMSCGQIALTNLGCKINKYWATEVDKWPIMATRLNFPDTIQLGNAFQVREENFLEKLI